MTPDYVLPQGELGEPRPPVISVTPTRYPQIAEAVLRSGAVLGPPGAADGVVWTDPDDAESLASILIGSPARWVQLPFAGVEKFAREGLLDHERTWTSAKGIYGPTVAEHALAFILAAARGLPAFARLQTWTEQGDVPTSRLTGRRVLILGTGGIGRALARLLEPHEPIIQAVNRSGTPMAGASSTAPVSELPAIIGQAHFVVIAAPLTEETEGMFDATLLGAMSRQAWLINVGRGKLVDTDALVDALANHRLAGAALDVTDPEPLPDGHPLWSMDNVLITPHVANSWDMALMDLAARVERNVIAFVHGQPLEGVVDVDLAY